MNAQTRKGKTAMKKMQENKTTVQTVEMPKMAKIPLIDVDSQFDSANFSAILRAKRRMLDKSITITGANAQVQAQFNRAKIVRLNGIDAGIIYMANEFWRVKGADDEKFANVELAAEYLISGIDVEELQKRAEQKRAANVEKLRASNDAQIVQRAASINTDSVHTLADKIRLLHVQGYANPEIAAQLQVSGTRVKKILARPSRSDIFNS
jgi:DNA-binding CsgD family transcriptional regulator